MLIIVFDVLWMSIFMSPWAGSINDAPFTERCWSSGMSSEVILPCIPGGKERARPVGMDVVAPGLMEKS